jgi:hypothetical protein
MSIERFYFFYIFVQNCSRVKPCGTASLYIYNYSLHTHTQDDGKRVLFSNTYFESEQNYFRAEVMSEK